MRKYHPESLRRAEDGEIVEENQPQGSRDFVAALNAGERPNDVPPNQQPLPTSVAQFGQHRERPTPQSPLKRQREDRPAAGLPSGAPPLPPLDEAHGRAARERREQLHSTPGPPPRRGKGSPRDALDAQFEGLGIANEERPASGPDLARAQDELNTTRLEDTVERLEVENEHLRSQKAKLEKENEHLKERLSAVETENTGLQAYYVELRELKAKLHRVAEEHPL